MISFTFTKDGVPFILVYFSFHLTLTLPTISSFGYCITYDVRSMYFFFHIVITIRLMRTITNTVIYFFVTHLKRNEQSLTSSFALFQLVKNGGNNEQLHISLFHFKAPGTKRVINLFSSDVQRPTRAFPHCDAASTHSLLH